MLKNSCVALPYNTVLPYHYFPSMVVACNYFQIIALPYHYFPNHRFACYSQVPVSGTYLFGVARVLELTRGA